MNNTKHLLVILYGFVHTLFVNIGYSQNIQRYYNVDTFLTVISSHRFIKNVLTNADDIYKEAGIEESNVSLNAFRIGYLEKVMLDSGKLDNISKNAYKNKDIFTVVDFTKKGDCKR